MFIVGSKCRQWSIKRGKSPTIVKALGKLDLLIREMYGDLSTKYKPTE